MNSPASGPQDIENLNLEEENVYSLELVDRIKRDFLDYVGTDIATLSRDETRFMVSQFYDLQENRMQSDNRIRALANQNAPKSALQFIRDQIYMSEKNVEKILTVFSDTQEIGQWAKSIPGVGPILSAALIAHIDITKAPTVGHIWSFAGLNPTSSWVGRTKSEDLVEKFVTKGQKVTEEQIALIAEDSGRRADAIQQQLRSLDPDAPNNNMNKTALIKVLSRRPWNSELKVVCWKLGQSFQKVKGRDTKSKGPDIYGTVYSDRKAYEIQKNEAGDYRDMALAKSKTVGRSTEAYKSYSIGKLPAGHLDARARRYAVKLFLAHYHHVAYELEYGTPPPKPYILDGDRGHTHYIAPPKWPMEG